MNTPVKSSKNLLKVALCDDDLVVETQIRAFLEKEEAERGGDQKILLSVKRSGEELLSDFRPGLYDLLLLDIMMEGINGVETLSRIREFDSDLTVAFITSSKEYALDGYRLKAVRYLEKPLTRDAISELIDITFEKKQEQPSLTVRPRGETKNVPLPDIEYISQSGHTVEIHLFDKNVMTFTGRLDEIEEDIKKAAGVSRERVFSMGSGFSFVRSHKSFIVNLDYADEIDQEYYVFRMECGDPVHIRREDFYPIRVAFQKRREEIS